MKEIVFYARGGQGAVTAAAVLVVSGTSSAASSGWTTSAGYRAVVVATERGAVACVGRCAKLSCPGWWRAVPMDQRALLCAMVRLLERWKDAPHPVSG